MRQTPTPRIQICFLLLLLLPTPSALAEMCTLDAVPAATLLLPYFEVDLDNANGTNTLFTIHNATTEPTVAHITFWTNYSQPTLDFDIFLTGYDMQVVNLRDIFDLGNLPITADEQSDPADTISPHGNHPEWDGSFTTSPDCINFFPFYINPLIIGSIADRVINGHTGKPIAALGDNCLGAQLGDNIARGYITMDNARSCSVQFPSDPGYFHEELGVALSENRLWGDFIIQNPADGTQMRDTLVHIEADPSFEPDSSPSGLTFYGRFSGGDDHREPLANQWAVRYMNDTDNSFTSDLLVWRDSTSSQDVANTGFDCAESPDWFPLDEASILCFDEQENDVEICGEPDEACFPYETQRVRVGAGNLALPYDAGWCLLDLNTNDSFQGDVDFPFPGSPVGQSYVVVLDDNAGFYASGSRATALGTSCDVPASYNTTFADGFENGNTSAWSLLAP